MPARWANCACRPQISAPSPNGKIRWRRALTSVPFSREISIPPMLKRGGSFPLFSHLSCVVYTVGFPQTSCVRPASKAGMIGLTKALSPQIRSQNLRSMRCLPGGTDTPMGPDVREHAGRESAFVKSLHALKLHGHRPRIANSSFSSILTSVGFVRLHDRHGANSPMACINQPT